MPVILLEKDPFVEALATQSQEEGFKNENVRRPLYGISVKSPRFAFVSVQQADGEGNLVPISLDDSSAPGGKSNANHNFILQNVEHQKSEKFQIIETFGDHFTFFYGERPVILQCSGFLINTRDFNWKNEWFANYEKYLRGTKCVENRARVYLGFDDVLVEGYMLTTGVSYDKDMPYICPFQFQILVTNDIDLSTQEDPVAQSEDARTLEDGSLVEYLSTVVEHKNWEVNDLTGISEYKSGGSGNEPASISDSGTNTRTAFWASPLDPPFKQWLNEDEALISLSTTLASQEAGADPVTVRQQLKQNSSSFPLGQRTDAVSELGLSLGSGIANGVAVIADAPDIE